MNEEVSEVTPTAALSVTTTLFLELSASLHKQGVISATELGGNLLAAAREAEVAGDDRAVVVTLHNVGQSLIDEFGSNSELISLDHQHDVHDWCIALGCSEEKLRKAVSRVGDSAQEVRRFLTRR